jgi:hypothetical protein
VNNVTILVVGLAKKFIHLPWQIHLIMGFGLLGAVFVGDGALRIAWATLALATIWGWK